MGNTSSAYTVKREYEPLFLTDKIYDYICNEYDLVMSSQNDTDKNELIESLGIKQYSILNDGGYITSTCEFCLFESDDPEFILESNGDDIHLGICKFLLFKSLAAFTQFTIKCKKPIKMMHYICKDSSIFGSLLKVKLNMKINGIYLVYSGGVFGKSDYPFKMTLEGNPKFKYKDTKNVSAYVYSNNIQLLQNHADIGKYADNWTKDIVFYSAPPCISVTVHENKIKEFEDFARNVLPDVSIKWSNHYDHALEPIDPEVAKKEAKEELESQCQEIDKLIKMGILSYEN